ncbi:MAG: NAD(P)-dependent oxidoreductase [Pseudomonadota bacterium]
MRSVGVVGLGAMGLPMAKTLAAKGFAVTGVDVSETRRAAFSPSAADLEAISEVDAALLSLPDDGAVTAVVARLGALLGEGAVIVDTSTIGPDTARAMHDEAARHGIGYLDAPVSGGAAGAAAGALLVMVGGKGEDIDKALPLLEALAKKVARCGGPGAGAVVKLANNMLCAGQLLLAGEALRMAEAGGVTPEALLDALNAGSGRSAVTEVNLPRWVLPQAFDSGFTMALMAKDVSLAAQLAGAGKLAAEISERWQGGAEALGGAADFNRIVERAVS